MAKNLTDLNQICTTGKHPGRSGMTQPMGVNMRDPGPQTGRFHDSPDPANRQALVWGTEPSEHSSAVTSRSASTDPTSDRLADIARKWKPFDPAAFAPNDQVAGSPVNVGQLQRGDLSGA